MATADGARGSQATPGPVREIAVAVIRDGDRVVVATRAASAHLARHAEFPGGHREPGESLEEAAVREAREETGLEVRVVRRLATARHADARRVLELSFFECACTGSSELAPEAVRTREARWVERRRLGELDFPPANAAVVRALAQSEGDA
jgi:mutator protein MutT